MKVFIQWQDQFGAWKQYQTKYNQRDAFRVASNRAKSTGKRHRIVNTSDQLLDLLEP